VIVDGLTLSSNVDRRCQVAIIGTGAGGGMLARALSLAGAQVVMIEEGGLQSSRDFDMEEATAFPMLYQEQGNRATADLSIMVLQGRTVGGGTVVNWTTSFRTPSRVLDYWRETYGVEGWSEDTLRPHWESAETYLGIHQVPEDEVNPNNRKLWDGLGKLGWSRELLRRNTRGCMRSGYCGMGCPIDAKQSMLITAVPDALGKGADLYHHVRVQTLAEERGHITEIRAEPIDWRTGQLTGRSITLRPDICVISAGALNGPALLMRSKLDRNGQVGKRTFLHPTIAMLALHAEPVEGFYGAPQTVASHQFADRGAAMGYFLEVPPLHPMLAALAMNSFGREQRATIERLAYTSAVIGLCVDGFDPNEPAGTVTLRHDGMPKLDYPFTPRLAEAARAAQVDAARVLLASGAREVRSLHNTAVVLRSEKDLPALASAPFAPNRLAVFTAHQMGGCAMGRDPERSVVRSDLRHHQIENLFIVDGSVFPTSLGVNPQLSIYGVAGMGAGHVLKALGRG
jgi:choline dehydrogenase-like flavoprotein